MTSRPTSAAAATRSPLETAVVPTPTGALAVVVDREGDGSPVVVASGFTSVADQLSRLDPATLERGSVARDDIPGVTDRVAAYLDGDLGALDDVAVRQPGGPFMQEAWRVMRQIPAGTTWTYAELAAKAGRPSAVRAAGGACAHNLVAPFVPCHRVLRTGGSLGGYYYGLDVKQWLLTHEGALLG